MADWSELTDGDGEGVVSMDTIKQRLTEGMEGELVEQIRKREDFLDVPSEELIKDLVSEFPQEAEDK